MPVGVQRAGSAASAPAAGLMSRTAVSSNVKRLIAEASHPMRGVASGR